MKRLQQVVDAASAELVQYGDSKIDVDALRQQLREVQRNNRTLLWICVIATLVLLVAMVGATFLHFETRGVIQVLLAVFGASAAGMIRWLVALWREKTLIEMYVVTATYGKGDVVRQVTAFIKDMLSKRA